MNNTKPWYKSKAIWTSIIGVALGVYEFVDVSIMADTLPNIPEWLILTLGSFGIYALRVGDKKIQ